MTAFFYPIDYERQNALDGHSMTPKTLKMAAVISLSAHVIAFSVFMWGASFFGRIDLGGKGNGDGIVSVWVADNEGVSVGEKTPVPQKRQVPKDLTTSSKENVASKENVSGNEGVGTGNGIGNGVGEGVGSGTNGDPRFTQIWKKINSSKYYPQIAKVKKLEGTPRVTFEINGDGSVKTVSIASSSGEKILDDAALETVHRATPLPFYPGPITVTVKYSLK